MILADTSAWVEFDRATGSPVHRRLAHLGVVGTELAVTEPVIAEVVAGARTDARDRDLRRALARAVLLPFEAAQDLDGAAAIYRRCRQVGVTPRGLVDCLVAAVARRSGAAAHRSCARTSTSSASPRWWASAWTTPRRADRVGRWVLTASDAGC